MKTRMKLDATKAGFIGTDAVEDYHAAHVEHLMFLERLGIAALPRKGGFSHAQRARPTR